MIIFLFLLFFSIHIKSVDLIISRSYLFRKSALYNEKQLYQIGFPPNRDFNISGNVVKCVRLWRPLCIKWGTGFFLEKLRFFGAKSLPSAVPVCVHISEQNICTRSINEDH